MKKLIVLCTIIVAVILLAVISGCQSPPESEPWLEPAHTRFGPPPEGLTSYGSTDTYADVGKTISLRVGEEFAIALYRNPRLGRFWDEIHDQNMLSLVESEYIPFSPSMPVDGTQYFLFKALETGKTRITFTYRHGATGPTVEQKVFNVEVK